MIRHPLNIGNNQMLTLSPRDVIYECPSVVPVSFTGISETISRSKSTTSLPMVKLGNEIVTDLALQVRNKTDPGPNEKR